MKLTQADIHDIREWFEDNLGCIQRVDKKVKMRMRKKIRDELFLLLTWEKPSPTAIMNRWEDRLSDVFSIMPYGFRDNLLKMLTKKIDLYEMGNWFEGALSRTRKVDKRAKVRMRKKIRDELFLLLTKEQSSPVEIMNKWQDRLSDVFAAMPYGFKDDLLQMLKKFEKSKFQKICS
jgi:hypothetical protein